MEQFARPPKVLCDSTIDYADIGNTAVMVKTRCYVPTPARSYQPLTVHAMAIHSVHDSPEEIRKAKASGHVYAVKLYPAGEDALDTIFVLCIPTHRTHAFIALLKFCSNKILATFRQCT